MKKNFLSQLVLIVLFFINSSCSFVGLLSLANPNKFDEENRRLREKETQVRFDELFHRGGQPGNVEISGVLVNADSTLNERITLTLKGGTGKDGKEVEIVNKENPKLTPGDENHKNSSLEGLNTFASVGCDVDTLDEANKNGPLKFQQIQPQIKDDEMTIFAEKVFLCGDLNETKYNRISINAEEIVLHSINLKITNYFGLLFLQTNKLTLVGNNKIETKGIDEKYTLSSAPSIYLKVSDKLNPIDAATLEIKATGSSYVE